MPCDFGGVYIRGTQPPEDRFIAFATNARWVDVVKYGKRWGIETG